MRLQIAAGRARRAGVDGKMKNSSWDHFQIGEEQEDKTTRQGAAHRHASGSAEDSKGNMAFGEGTEYQESRLRRIMFSLEVRYASDVKRLCDDTHRIMRAAGWPQEQCPTFNAGR